ncbi:hypothetical protein HAX54_000696 [Datura stramonium]|uniref:Uncharacterized protein n=1 Tax=Datura stramonium TaxID=4076 RepID=A0ABS8T2D1_DATST|nr:hypothetical protein [Datura stramonium]
MGLPLVLAHVSSGNFLTLCGEQISVVLIPQLSRESPLCDKCVVWVMNQYGKLEPWMEKFVVDLKSERWDRQCYWVSKKWEFLIEQDPEDLSSYDPESGELYDLGIYGRGDSFFMRKYVESLVLLDGSSGATTDPSIASESEYTSSDSE